MSRVPSLWIFYSRCEVLCYVFLFVFVYVVVVARSRRWGLCFAVGRVSLEAPYMIVAPVAIKGARSFDECFGLRN